MEIDQTDRREAVHLLHHVLEGLRVASTALGLSEGEQRYCLRLAAELSTFVGGLGPPPLEATEDREVPDGRPVPRRSTT